MTTHFYNGFEVVTVAEVPTMPNMVLVQVTKDYRLDSTSFSPNIKTDWMVKKADLQLPIYEAFKQGEHVRNKFGSMVGTVVGFEYHTNRAVVMSDKIDKYEQKRTRYVYGLDELELVSEKQIKLVPGQWYRINGKKKLMLAVQSVFEQDEVMIFNKAGQVIYKSLPKIANFNWLRVKHSIETIEIAE